MAKKRVKKSTKKRYKALEPKERKDLRLLVVLTAIVMLLVFFGKPNQTNGTVIIKNVDHQEVADNSFVFYYTVENPSDSYLECDIVVEISGKPYTNKVSLQPNAEKDIQTTVEMPNGESTIKIYPNC